MDFSNKADKKSVDIDVTTKDWPTKPIGLTSRHELVHFNKIVMISLGNWYETSSFKSYFINDAK